MTETVDIAFALDDKFSDLCRVAIHSIAKNTKSNLAIHVVDCGISEANVDRIRQLEKAHENILSVNFGTPKRVEACEKKCIPDRFSSAIFYRLAIPKVFPGLRRVIYLDCDVIAVGDISELWTEDLRGRPFGAIEEDGTLFPSLPRRKMKNELGIPERNVYYNSGVLLIDCQRFEKSKIFERVINVVQRVQFFLKFPEQDAMNMCLKNDEHMPLSPKYNFIPCAPLAKLCLKKIRKPVIIQYASFKPWIFNRSLMRACNSLGLFKFSTSIFLKFWECADEVEFPVNAEKNICGTLNFFYKELLQPIERFFRWKFKDTPISFFREYLKCKTLGAPQPVELRDEVVDIAFSLDNRFSNLVKIALHSIAKNTKSKLAIHIVDCGISKENAKEILRMEKKYGNILSIELKAPKKEDTFEKFPLPACYSSAVFYRFAIPKTFPNLRRVIYMDCDTVTIGDISELWNEDLCGRPLGAVPEYGDAAPVVGKKKRGRTPTTETIDSYNPGILLIDCERFVKSRILGRMVAFLQHATDQLAQPHRNLMSTCVRIDECVPLSCVYNHVPLADLSKKCIKDSGTPIIIHYAVEKPWMMHMPTVKFLNSMGLFGYSTSSLIAFWNCASAVDGVNVGEFSGKNISRTVRVFGNIVLHQLGRSAVKLVTHPPRRFANAFKSKTLFRRFR
ncbi:MAG: hypothetical protein LBB18_00210 [Puniceicoccales bacterium]|jgi:lipopolysaccharide biosynthesis glycosyltransferase|nr:hypothetical protein [Puniceicoccales bacterium]